jgi:hypothetical protein
MGDTPEREKGVYLWKMQKKLRRRGQGKSLRGLFPIILAPRLTT